MSTKRVPPKLPPSAFSPPPPAPLRRTTPRTVLDAHIHLWTPEQLAAYNITWPSKRADTVILNQDHTLDFFRAVVQHAASIGIAPHNEGEVYLQAEVVHDDSDKDGSRGGWDAAIQEVDAVCQATLATLPPRPLGIVPWAPVHCGPVALEAYIKRLEALPSLLTLTLAAASINDDSAATAVETSRPIKGFRYWLQESPAGFSLEEDFIAGLKWLGERGYTFDLDVNAGPKGRGPEVLEEVIECISRVHAGQPEGRETRFIIDHFAHPDLVNAPKFPLSASHSAYIRAIFSLSLLPSVYLKLSGLLDSADLGLVKSAFAEYRSAIASSFPDGPTRSSAATIAIDGAEDSVGETPASASPSPNQAILKRRILTFLEPALEAFGDTKLLVGSDWPMLRATTVSSTSVTTRDLDEEAAAYAFELNLYRQALVDLGLDGESLDRVFAGNARVFYSLGPA